MAKDLVSRREVLRTGAIAAGLAAVPAGGADTRGEGRDDAGTVVSGLIDRVDPPSSLSVDTVGGSVFVRFEEHATFWRGALTVFSAFEPGDEVVIEGAWQEGALVGTRMASPVRLVSGRVTRTDGNLLETTAGDLVLTESSIRAGETLRGAIRPSDVQTGDYVTASARLDRRSGRYYVIVLEFRRR